VHFDDGVIQVVYGSATGLDPAGNKRMNQNTSEGGVSVLDVAEDDDRFGTALAAGDFDASGTDDLAVGVEFEDVGADSDTGAVNVLYGVAGAPPAGGLRTTGNEFWTQDSPGILDTAEGSDRFGLTLAAGDIGGFGAEDLAIGAPGESVGTTNDAGGVTVIYGGAGGLSADGDQQWNQNIADVEDTAEEFDFLGIGLAIGDFNGDAGADLAIGVPSETVFAGGADRTDAGAVNVLYSACVTPTDCRLRPAGDHFLSQATPNLEGNPESFESFAQVLAAADFNGAGGDDLAVGVPRDLVGPPDDAVDAGGVNVVYASPTGLRASGPPADQLLRQDAALLDGVPENGDNFGAALAAGGSTGLDNNLVQP
jgi:hypothetical protein